MDYRGLNSIGITVDTAGAAGSASGSAQNEGHVVGTVEAIRLEYTGEPATTDVVIRASGSAGPVLVSVANASANDIFYPRTNIHTTAAASVSSEYTRHVIHGKVHLSVAQGDPSGRVTATVYFC